MVLALKAAWQGWGMSQHKTQGNTARLEDEGFRHLKLQSLTFL